MVFGGELSGGEWWDFFGVSVIAFDGGVVNAGGGRGTANALKKRA